MKNLIVLFVLVVASATVFGQKDKKLILKTVGPNDMKAHIHFLADDALKGRDTPSDGQAAAAAYIKAKFIQYGVEPASKDFGYLQPVPFREVNPMKEGTMTIGDRTLNFPKDFLMMDAKNQSLNAAFVFADYGLEADLKKIDVKGKIIVALCGNGEDASPRAWFRLRKQKAELAESAGAEGLIELYRSNQMPWKFIINRMTGAKVMLDAQKGKESNLPHFWINAADVELIDFLKSGGEMNIQTKGIKQSNFDAHNVVGIVEGTDPVLKNEYVIYSAHYDHVGVGIPDARGDSIYNGARDNAIGASAVIAAAKNLAKYPTKRSSMFILFTGEEKGLLGSKWFVDHSPVPLDKIAYCFNIDGAGYNDVKLVTVIGLERTTAQGHLLKACSTFGLKAISDPAPKQGLFDRSDNVNFAKKGIPAPTFSPGFTAFDAEISKYYHQAADEVESLDFNYLNKYSKAFIYAGRLIANDKNKPFWMPGDKYYEAGKALYGR